MFLNLTNEQKHVMKNVDLKNMEEGENVTF